MGNSTAFDEQAAHRFFSEQCFNDAWDLIEKAGRTPDEDEEMAGLAHASLWHWMRREDCTDKNRSIGCWQVSRVYAILSEPEISRRYAQLALDYSQGGEPVYTGFAYEALARADWIDGNAAGASRYLQDALEQAGKVEDAEDRQALEGDLAELQKEIDKSA